MSKRDNDTNETWIHGLSVSPEEIAWEAFKAGFGWGNALKHYEPTDNNLAYIFDVWRKQTRKPMNDSEVRRAGVPKPL